MAAIPPKVLLVESSTALAEPLLIKLHDRGYSTRHCAAETLAAFQSTLDEYQPNIVLCNFDNPAFDSQALLAYTRSKLPDAPFILLTSTPDEETLFRASQIGADDCLGKTDTNRLAPVIAQHLRKIKIRGEYRETQRALQDNQARLRTFIENLPGMACQILLKPDGSLDFPYVSEGVNALLGISQKALQSQFDLFFDMVHQADRASFQHSMRQSAEKLSFWNWEGRIQLPPNNEIKWINLRCSPTKFESGDTLWEGMLLNITQSKRSELEISRSKEQLRALSSHIQDAIEQERLKISREVHDHLGSMLTAIKLDIGWLENKIPLENNQVRDKINEIEELTGKCLAAARNISQSLRPSALDNFGIIAAMEYEINEFIQRTDIRCNFNHVDDEIELSDDASITLFRVFQEALTNIIKHAHANRVDIDILNQEDGVELTITDNGKGITSEDQAKPRSFGLRGIHERVTHLGGTMTLASGRKKGTTLSVFLPHGTAQTGDEDQKTQAALF
jgi:signal transduction histidine kinase/FixJ family two-component response regulator